MWRFIAIYHSSHMGDVNRRIVVQASIDKNARPYVKKQKGLGEWLK
jgi:hypothetical protein